MTIQKVRRQPNSLNRNKKEAKNHVESTREAPKKHQRSTKEPQPLTQRSPLFQPFEWPRLAAVRLAPKLRRGPRQKNHRPQPLRSKLYRKRSGWRRRAWYDRDYIPKSFMGYGEKQSINFKRKHRWEKSTDPLSSRVPLFLQDSRGRCWGSADSAESPRAAW